MRGKLLGAAFLTLLSVNVYAQDQANQPVPDSTQPAPAAVQPAPAVVQPAPADVQPAPADVHPAPAAQTINCEYNISPETKTIDNALVLEWAKQAAIQSFDLDHTNLTQQFATLEACYTKEGWKGFNDALEKSGNLHAIKTQTLMVSSQIIGNAEINALQDNQWKVTLPLQVVYKNNKETLTQDLTVTLNIGRQTNGNLGIMQLIAVPKQQNSQPHIPIQTHQPLETDTSTHP